VTLHGGDEHTPVLIVGGGYASLASSLFLSEHGVRPLLVDRHPGPSIQRRAHGINQRTMELYRPLGPEPAITAAGAPFAGEAGVVRCETLTGPWEWLFAPEPDAAAEALSPARFCMADRNAVEPILIAAASCRGADLRFNTELISFSADGEGVSAIIEDRATRQRRTVRAD
jgi:putative polyketide hydroxylase